VAGFGFFSFIDARTHTPAGKPGSPPDCGPTLLVVLFSCGRVIQVEIDTRPPPLSALVDGKTMVPSGQDPSLRYSLRIFHRREKGDLHAVPSSVSKPSRPGIAWPGFMLAPPMRPRTAAPCENRNPRPRLQNRSGHPPRPDRRVGSDCVNYHPFRASQGITKPGGGVFFSGVCALRSGRCGPISAASGKSERDFGLPALRFR